MEISIYSSHSSLLSFPFSPFPHPFPLSFPSLTQSTYHLTRSCPDISSPTTTTAIATIILSTQPWARTRGIIPFTLHTHTHTYTQRKSPRLPGPRAHVHQTPLRHIEYSIDAATPYAIRRISHIPHVPMTLETKRVPRRIPERR